MGPVTRHAPGRACCRGDGAAFPPPQLRSGSRRALALAPPPPHVKCCTIASAKIISADMTGHNPQFLRQPWWTALFRRLQRHEVWLQSRIRQVGLIPEHCNPARIPPSAGRGLRKSLGFVNCMRNATEKKVLVGNFIMCHTFPLQGRSFSGGGGVACRGSPPRYRGAAPLAPPPGVR
jgi:hypothetical protein